MLISIVACIADDNVIGYNGMMPWEYFKEDMSIFKQITSGKHVIMGSTTFKSIGKPLSGRHNIVICRNPREKFSEYISNKKHNITFVTSFVKALQYADTQEVTEVCVIGGQSVYEQAMPYADILYLTELYKDYPGDTFFPDFDSTLFHATSRYSSTDEKCRGYAFVKYAKHMTKTF